MVHRHDPPSLQRCVRLPHRIPLLPERLGQLIDPSHLEREARNAPRFGIAAIVWADHLNDHIARSQKSE